MDSAAESELAFDIGDTWQARVLLATRRENLGNVLLSALAHQYDAECMLVLLQSIFPGFVSIAPPFICSAAKVDKSGCIIADIVSRDERVIRNVVLFESELHLRDEFRRLADRLRLSDEDREQMFITVQRWVTADTRLDPTMDPQDPDAKRLIH